jgi:siroheme synthase-like protein
MINKTYLPISIDIADKRILIVGGGNVALHKLKSLLLFTHDIAVCALRIREEIKNMDIVVREQPYHKDILDGFFLVYACTDSEEVNQQVKDDAHARNILVNVADNSRLSDFISPAIYKKGDMTIAVASQGRDVKKAVAWRDAIKRLFDLEQTPTYEESVFS